MSTSFINDLVFSFTLDKDYENWQLQTFHGTATHPTLGEVATLSGYLIYRGMLRGDFLGMLDEESQELQEFAVALFDQNGLLKPRIKTGYRSGTGCWGDELTEDALAYIEDIIAKDEYRRQGIGSQLLRGLREWEQASGISTIMCWPSTKDGAAPKAFFTKNGFRRIGRTQFFGYSMDPEHPSHRILASDDVQQSVREEFPLPPEPPYREMLASGQDPYEISDNMKRERQQKFPIHCAILSDGSESIADLIRRAHETDPHSLYVPDEVGFLPMHVAVQAKNKMAFDTLLELGRVEDLQNHHNADGATPVELLRDSMVSGREFMETMLSVNWTGYSDADLSMEYATKTAMGMDTGSATVQEYIDQNKYGCTCGRCLGGWLSPRMIFQLRVKAAFSMDTMPMEGDYTFKKRQVIDASEVDTLYNAEFIPPSLYPSFYLSFYRGFTAVFRAAFDILKQASPFNARTVYSQACSAYLHETNFFFNKGGKVEYALDSITSDARDQSMVGDREFYTTFGDDEGFVALPTCANDNEFGLVRRMVGLDPEKQWAPYRQLDNDEDMDDDEDDSDEDMEDDEDASDEEGFGRRGAAGKFDPVAMMAVLQRMAAAR